MKAYRKFNRIVLCSTLVGLLKVGAFNLMVDPYGIINSPVIEGFNQEKPKEASHVRLFKAADTFRIDPKTIFLGTSRVEYGLDPHHPAIAAYQPVYNLGLPSSNIYEQLRYLEHAIANQPNLEVVVLGLDFFAFSSANKNEIDFYENRLGRSYLTLGDFLRATLSIDTLESSIETVAENRDHQQDVAYYPNGMRNESFFASEQPMIDIFRQYIRSYLHQPEYYGDYSLSKEMMDSLKAIVDLCRKHNIRLKVFISPFHASQLEAIHAAGLGTTFEEWKRQVVEITPIWDFSIYNAITTEPITNQMQYFKDSVHYENEVGNLILNLVLGYQEERIPENFGVWVTSDTIETHLEEIRSDRRIWVEENRETVEMVQSLRIETSSLH